MTVDEFARLRARRVSDQLASRGIRDARLLSALGRVLGREFLRSENKDDAYPDCAVPIEERQTISQPYIVVSMTQMPEHPRAPKTV